MPEMLTVGQTLDRIKETYPNTPITAYTLRLWQKQGCVHSVRAGQKILISWNSLVDFLSGK